MDQHEALGFGQAIRDLVSLRGKAKKQQRQNLIRPHDSIRMTHYDKGSFFERQLKALFEAKGFFVVRAAGSGVAGDAPDLIVLRSGQKNKFGVECKAWKNAIYLDKPTVIAYQEWEKITGMQVFLAWKVPRKEWRFPRQKN